MLTRLLIINNPNPNKAPYNNEIVRPCSVFLLIFRFLELAVFHAVHASHVPMGS